ncbi:MAG TPA: hypothetical protein VM487_24185 [Phycisphaerae bacterium]|nr:hypothetical protein [Phycisphaerae bacterium]
MSVANTTDGAVPASPWVAGVRLLLAIGLVWAGLHFVIDQTVLARGLQRPVVILASGSGLLAALAVAVVLWVGAVVGTLLAGARENTRTLFVIGVALALWAAGDGTMDDWLLLQNQLVQDPRGAPYWPLLGEYVYLGVVIAGVAALGSWSLLGQRVSDAAARRAALRRTFALDAGGTGWREGVTALLVTAVVAGVLMLVLFGPREGHTRRGQVYFAVAVAFILGVMAARRLTRVHHPLWYWLAPFVVGIVGVLLAAFKPALPQPHHHLDMIPAWGLVRPLPVEMVGVGVATIIWTLRTTSRLSGEGVSS